MRKRIWCLFGALLLLLWLAWGNTALTVTGFTIKSNRIPGAFDRFRIVQISDLHNETFGEGNKRLLRRVRSINPDIIVITGDMVDHFRTDVEAALGFAEKALEIAPVYYVTGNHESAAREYQSMKIAMEEMGVCVLENESVCLEREDARVTLMGVMDPGFLQKPYQESVAAILEELGKGNEAYTILLSHRPELFETYVSAGIDLVFSGHAHGGQFRVPLIGGLYSPGQGWFPRYDAGQFIMGRTHMIVSRGLGNSRFPLRINNPPEIVVAELRSIPAG